MPPPDQPQKPKPNMPEAARQALLAREAAAKARAAAGVGAKPVVKAPPPPPGPVEPPKPRMDVGLAGFLVWLLAAAEALSLIYWYRVGETGQALVLPRQVGAGLIGLGLLAAIWFTQELEKDARRVKLVWVLAIFTIVAAPAVFLVTWDRSKVSPRGGITGVRGFDARAPKAPAGR